MIELQYLGWYTPGDNNFETNDEHTFELLQGPGGAGGAGGGGGAGTSGAVIIYYNAAELTIA